jgi:hypothetical protein
MQLLEEVLWYITAVKSEFCLRTYEKDLFQSTALFWVIAQRVVVNPYRRFGATSEYRLLKLVWIVVPKLRQGIITTTRCVPAQKNAFIIY